jgi:hypothetical protein
MPATAKTRQRRHSRPVWKSRAVVRTIEAGSDAYCEYCGERVKFQAKHKHQQVICNVYVKGVWARVEHYHSACYDQAGEPHGAAAA